MQVTEMATAPQNRKRDFREDERSRNRESKVMLASDGDGHGAVGYKVLLEAAQSEFMHPRHRHNFHQIRYVIAGEFVYGKDHGKDISLKAGEVCYFPESIYYGPQVRKPGLRQIIIQWGDVVVGHRLDDAYDKLVQSGSFSKGIYTFKDAEGKTHNQDAYEAIWEHLNGRKLTYPEPRYTSTLAIQPENFAWVEVPDAPGQARKWLGTFTEGEAKIGFVRLAAGATLTAGLQSTTEILFVTKGSVRCGDRAYGHYTAFGFEPADGKTIVEAAEPAELLHFIAPKG